MYKKIFKRILDIIASGVAIILLLIPLLIIAIAIKIDSPGPALFTQKRFGIHKKPFTLLKFRSMPTDAPNYLPTRELDVKSIHMTKWQKTIRKYSIDELPQLLNIFVGHCSFVGPRPVICDETDLIIERDKYGANDIKPGLTGLAQINGRDGLDNFKKAALDGEYTVALNSGGLKGLKMDIKCFFGTFKVAIRHENVFDGSKNQSGDVALPETEPKESAIHK